MTRQWIRAINLTMGSASGSSIDMSQLRVRFDVKMWNGAVPNMASIWVTNLSDATAALVQKEYDTVTLEAGYQDSIGLIFKSGTIIQKRVGQESPTETYLEIIARDGDPAYNRAVICKSLAAGSTYRDQVNALLEPMKKLGISVGYITDLGSKRMPRGISMFGMVRDYLREIADATGTAWSIQNGTFQMVKNQEALPGAAVVLNARTGMVGMPTQTLNGLEIRALLNPELRIGTLLEINNSDVQTAEFDPNYGAEAQNMMIPPLSSDGHYLVQAINWVGDTRGDPWYADIVAISANPADRRAGGLVERGIGLP
jgi:hypothetical protein